MCPVIDDVSIRRSPASEIYAEIKDAFTHLLYEKVKE